MTHDRTQNSIPHQRRHWQRLQRRVVDGCSLLHQFSHGLPHAHGILAGWTRKRVVVAHDIVALDAEKGSAHLADVPVESGLIEA